MSKTLGLVSVPDPEPQHCLEVVIFFSFFHSSVQVMEIIAAVQEVDIEQLAEQVYTNTAALFFPSHHS